TPAFHARLSARNVLFCAGSSASAVPEPVILPEGGRIAAALGLVSNPTPGTLSNDAASGPDVRLYAVGFAFGSGREPSGFIRDPPSADNGSAAVVTVTPIDNGNVHPAASYGWLSGSVGDERTSGYFCGSSTSRARAANS